MEVAYAAREGGRSSVRLPRAFGLKICLMNAQHKRTRPDLLKSGRVGFQGSVNGSDVLAGNIHNQNIVDAVSQKLLSGFP